MKNNIELNLSITISKIGALAIIVLSPIFLDGPMILSGWLLAGGMLGVKQGVDAIKKIKGGTDE
jgi:hypothetical protein